MTTTLNKTQMRRWCAGAALLAASQLAAAHTPYLLPLTFSVSRPHVSLQAAISDELFFVPEGALRTDYYVVNPAGVRSKLERLTHLKDFTSVEADTPETGTYRFVTGDEGARVTRLVKIDGTWRMVRAARNPNAQQAQAGGDMQPRPATAASAPARAAPPGPPRFVDEAAIPAGAETTEVLNLRRLETYVSKGAPSRGALATSGQGLEVRPVTHPNEIFIDQGFTFDALVDGAPVPGLEFTVYRAGNAYEDKKVFAEAKTDPRGRIALKFDKPGIYLMTARYPAASSGPIVEKPAPRSYGYTLTFEVFQ